MSELETMVRDALTDDRRRMAPPPDASGWVRTAARRQRRRNALLGSVVGVALAVAAAGAVVSLLTDTEAVYVAGPPPASSGLLAWEPAGSLDGADIRSAMDAWSEQSEDQPAGAVYLVAGDVLQDTTVAVLQGVTEDGAPSVAFVVRGETPSDAWRLRGVLPLPSDGAVEALLLPSDTVTLDRKRVGADNPASLVLAPEWRTDRSRDLGWQRDPAGQGFGEQPQWRPLKRFIEWWAPLDVIAPGLSPTTLMLTHGNGGKAERVPVLEIDGSGDLSALVASDLSFRVLRADDARPETLDVVRTVAARLGLDGPVEVTVLDSITGAVSVGHSGGKSTPTSTLFAQFRSPEFERPRLVAYSTTAGEITCFSQRPVPGADVAALGFVGAGCPAPVTGSRSDDVQGNLLMAHSFMDEPELKSPVLDMSVTIERTDGSSTTHDMPDDVSSLYLTEEAAAPVRRYVFTATETFDFTELDPWVWPGGRESQP